MQCLRFLHIPKTAGTTFTGLLRNLYKEESIFSFTGNIEADRERYDSLPAYQQEQIALFVGHAPLKTGIVQADQASIITFFRDPISRVKSFCQHVAEGKSRYLLNAFPPSSFDLDAFLDSGNTELSNFQVKMLINRIYVPDIAADMTREQAVDEAMAFLNEQISLYGIQAYFEQSLALFASTFNWDFPPFKNLNRASPVQPLTFNDRHIKKITALNAMDIEFFNHVKTRFEQRTGITPCKTDWR